MSLEEMLGNLVISYNPFSKGYGSLRINLFSNVGFCFLSPSESSLKYLDTILPEIIDASETSKVKQQVKQPVCMRAFRLSYL